MGDVKFEGEDHDIGGGFIGVFTDDYYHAAFDRLLFFPEECTLPYEEVRKDKEDVPIVYGSESSRHFEEENGNIRERWVVKDPSTYYISGGNSKWDFKGYASRPRCIT